MPTSYQAPRKKDAEKSTTYSQSSASNMSDENTKIQAILSRKGEDVFSIGPDDTLGDAVQILRDRRIGALVVTNDVGGLIGILSERDIVRKLAETPGKTLPQRVEEVMTSNVQTCTPDDSLIAVMSRMSEGRFRHMPVMKGDKLAGMITIGDVVNHRLTELEHEALQLKQLIVG